MNKLFVAVAALALAAPNVAEAAEKEKRPLLAAGLNWIVPGVGYAYNGEKSAAVWAPMIVGAVGLTYVENFHTFEGGGSLQETDSTAFGVMFGSVLILNTGLAVDAYREAKGINERAASAGVDPEEGDSWAAELAKAGVR